MNVLSSSIKSNQLFRITWVLLAVAASQAGAQSVTVSIGSGSTAPGGGVTVPVTMTASDSALPAAVQWTMGYPSPDIFIVSVTAGASATAAGKSASCSSIANSITCIVYGTDSNIIGNGTLANVTLTVASGSLLTLAPIPLSGVAAASGSGDSIPGTGVAGTITIIQPVQPTLSGLTCTPSSLNPAGVSACTVTLSAAALTGGFAVAVASNNAYLTVPASVTVAAGALSAGFSASVAATVPASQTAMVTASAAAAIQTFSLSLAASTWTITGGVGTAGSGAAIALSGTSAAAATADASGSYTFSGLANGSYTITPSLSGYTFSPASVAVTVSGANVTAASFTATGAPASITIDATVSQDRSRSSNSIAVSALSTVSANELLLALIATGAVTGTSSPVMVTGVSGGGLTWVLVNRTQVQRGTAEIWSAFAPTPLTGVSITATLSDSLAASITVMSFAGVNTTGANGSGAIGATGNGNALSGAPQATLITTQNNSLVIGVGTDTSNAIARTIGSGQTMVHQYLASVSNTYWVQGMSSATAASGTSVTINDSAPTGDPYNLSIVEILAAVPAGSQTSSLMMPAAVSAAKATNRSHLVAPGASPILSIITTGQAGEACSPGGLATLLGAGLTRGQTESSSASPLPTRLAGVQVLVNGVPAPLLLASNSQINFQCPVLPPGTAMEIQVESESGALTSPLQTVMQAVVPVLFKLDATGRGLVTIAGTNEFAMATTDGISGRPARRGEYLTIHSSGLGQVVDGVDAGTAAPLNRPILTKTTIKLVLGDIEIDSEFAGLAPGTVGLYQVNAQVPLETPAGPAVPLYLKATLPDGTIVRSNIVTVAVADATK